MSLSKIAFSDHLIQEPKVGVSLLRDDGVYPNSLVLTRPDVGLIPF